ncbi:MAG: hypothetical protein U0232_25415 [Thermomicrobiales bacterium]
MALTEAGGVLDTGTLRRAAGFPTGKEQRVAYLKAVAELDAKLLLAKVFSPDDQDMRHILVQTRYPEHVAAAENLTRDAALDHPSPPTSPTLPTPPPPPLARHLGLPLPELRAALDRLIAKNQAHTAQLPGEKEPWVIWGHDSR